MGPAPSIDKSKIYPTSSTRRALEQQTLADWLRLECLARTSGVFQVIYPEQVTILHLNGGEIVHAETPNSTGEEALFDILSGTDGYVQETALQLSDVRTVNLSLEVILLRLEKLSDEMAYAQSENNRVNEKERHLRALPTTVRSYFEDPSAFSPSPTTDILLTDDGHLLQSEGMGAEELAQRMAYAARLADLIGEALGSGQPKSLELRGSHTKLVLCRIGNGNIAGSQSRRAQA